MDEMESVPVLKSNKVLKAGFEDVQTIKLTSAYFTLGRALKNTVVIPFVSISRNHCIFKKADDNEWYVEDNSFYGITINNEKLGHGTKRKLKHGDIISLEPSDEFVYKFYLPSDDVFEIPRKRIKMENADNDITNDVKIKFEESQQCEIKYIEDRIVNAQQMQTSSAKKKQRLQEDMKRKIEQLQNEFALQIHNLKGEKSEVKKQKLLLTKERDAQLLCVKNEMKGKIAELMEQIKKHNQTESELLNENNLLKEKLEKEREDFLIELNRESSSKQDMLEKLETKIRVQEEIRLKEKQELEDTLKRETAQLRLANEKELKELGEQKRERERELQQELSNIKKNLAEQVEQTEQQRIKAEQELKQQLQELKAEEKAKLEQLQEEILKKVTEAQMNAEKSSLEVLKARVAQRETELAALAAERIQKQVDMSSEVISTLQGQLEKVTSQLQNVETEKNNLLESMNDVGEGTSKQKESTLENFGELMESELQCSICAELFVQATTLNCSHTFCKYCITMWMKNKNDCPICRAPVTSQCQSLVLDTFIEKMVENLTEDMKTKRKDMLSNRAAEVQNSSKSTKRSSTRRSTSSRRGGTTTTTTTRQNIYTRNWTNSIATSTGEDTAQLLSPPAMQTVDLTDSPLRGTGGRDTARRGRARRGRAHSPHRHPEPFYLTNDSLVAMNALRPELYQQLQLVQQLFRRFRRGSWVPEMAADEGAE